MCAVASIGNYTKKDVPLGKALRQKKGFFSIKV